MTRDTKDLRDYLFRGLMFEAEAGKFQSAGIQVGADTKLAEEQLLSEALSPINVGTRNNALEMARLYAVLNCFENAVRALIRETLEEKDGADWIDKLPKRPRISRRLARRQHSVILGLKGESQIYWDSSISDSFLRS